MQTIKPTASHAAAGRISWLSQLIGVAKYEFLMHWRRPALFAAMLPVTLIGLLVTILSRETTKMALEQAVQGTATLTDALAGASGFALVITIWPVLYLSVMMMAGLMVADVMPRDRQLGVAPLLRSLPMPLWVNLGGKVIGMWLAAGAMLTAGLVIVCATWWALIGPFALERVFAMWVFGTLPLLILGPTLTVLLAAGQATRRQALFVGIVLMLMMLVMMGNIGAFSTGRDALNVETAWRYLNPARPGMLTYFMFGNAPAGSIPSGIQPPTTLQYVVIVVVGVLELVVIAGVMLWYLRRQETV